jgi:uncharacterized protein (TIGR02996 family)
VTATHPGFLAAILADPKDDTPRLIYADWLDDAGEYDRAEFIRVQCELASLPPFDGVTIIGTAFPEHMPDEPNDYLVNFEGVHIGDEVTASGLIRTQDLPKAMRGEVGQIGTLATDAAIVLRFNGQEAPKAVLDHANLKPRDGMIEARFRLFPVLDGERFLWYRPYSDPHEKRRLELEARELELLREDGPLMELFDRYFSTPEGTGFWIEGACFYAEFRRGFVSDLECPASAWLAHADAITEAQPIERATLTTLPLFAYDATSDAFFLQGRTHRVELVPDGSGEEEFRLALLASEWPRITFTLPLSTITANWATGPQAVSFGGIDLGETPIGPQVALMDAVQQEIEEAFPDVPVDVR